MKKQCTTQDICFNKKNQTLFPSLIAWKLISVRYAQVISNINVLINRSIPGAYQSSVYYAVIL